MFKFNNTAIFTGHIKQLLSSFNLPKYRVYTKEQAQYFLREGKESPTIIATTKKTFPTLETVTASSTAESDFVVDHTYYANYIKDNYIQRYIDGKWENTNLHYHYNKYILNHTKNLVVKNNIYDSYTHEYLGDYLRFMRDYNDVDLMSLYNCFSNRICANLKQTIPAGTPLEGASQKYTEFNSADGNYKIYMVPVKLFKKYTIAIDCPDTIEMFCGIYHRYLDTREKVQNIWKLTYRQESNLKFNNPILYTNLTELTDIVTPELAQQESNLRLFIKLPFATDSSIVILEGDYTYYNSSISKIVGRDGVGASIITTQQNKNIINLEHINQPQNYTLPDGTTVDYENLNLDPISSLQLLRFNTGESYPFADRLVEYLTDNVITNIDDIGDNVVRVQKVLMKNNVLYDTLGLWENKYRIILYETFMNETLNNKITLYSNDKLDCLGYVDKDMEQYYTYPQKYISEKTDAAGNKYKEEREYYISIGKVNIYDNIYRDQAEQIRKQREGKK